MIKYKALGLIFVLALLAVGVVLWAGQRPKMILFYSLSCPHCQVVEKYIGDNGVRDRFRFQELEVSQNQANASLMERKARACGLDAAQGLGVPFFFDGQNCLMGDQEIIRYFQK
ncbi:MAG: hypothetical protein WC453_00795 [Patescibacteria group bacterium]